MIEKEITSFQVTVEGNRCQCSSHGGILKKFFAQNEYEQTMPFCKIGHAYTIFYE